LTRNMVFGLWNDPINLKHKTFFTALIKKSWKSCLIPKTIVTKINFIFVGTLVKVKNCMPYKLLSLIEKRKGSVFEFIWRRCIERIVTKLF
jgi:hypothetical protein